MSDTVIYTETEEEEAEDVLPNPNLAKDFILARVAIPLNESTDNPIIRFDEAKEEFVADDDESCNGVPRSTLYGEADAERSRCLDEMKRFAKTFEIDLPDTQILTWNAIESFMNTEMNLEKNGKGFSEVGHQFLERVGDNGPSIQAWLDLLPGGEYSSLICGSFKLLITGAIYKGQLHKRIFEAISSIPGMLRDAKTFFDIYQSTRLTQISVELDKAFSKLVTAILSACICMFQYLHRESGRLKRIGREMKKYGKAVLKQGDYGNDIDEHISAVKLAADEVSKHAQFCLHSRIGSIAQATREIKGATRENSQLLLHIVEDNQKHRDEDKSKVIEVAKIYSEAMCKALDVMNGYYMNLLENKRKFDSESREQEFEAKSENLHDIFPTANTNREGIAIEGTDIPAIMPGVTQSKFLRYLKFNAESASNDLQSAMSTGDRSSEKDQERSQYVIYSPQFKHWLEMQHSELLIIDGNSEDIRISPMSFACSLLAMEMRTKPETIVLTYFCGEHTTTKKYPTGPQVMLHSLLGQLLESYDNFDVGFLDTPESSRIRKRLDRKSISQMSKIFEMLIQQLPRDKVVFCIIDGISFYEHGYNREDNIQVMEALKNIARNQEVDTAFKLLVTSPMKSRSIRARIAKSQNVLTVPEEISNTNQGFNLTRMHRAGHREMSDVTARLPQRVRTGWSTQESERAEEETTDSDSDGWSYTDDDDE